MESIKARFTTIALSITSLFTSTVYAQNALNTDDTKTSFFKFSINYLTNSVYYGRKDSLVVPYITPEISYHDKSGFYMAGSVSYLAGIGAQVDAGSLTAGYEFESKDERFSGDMFASKYFVSSSSYSVKGEVKAELGSSLDYNAGPVTINSGLDLSFSTKTDVAISLGLSHALQFGENKSWVITPSILANAGSQSFYESYFTNKKFSTKRRRRAAQTANNVRVIINHQGFGILDYELALPIDYAAHKWGLFVTPTFSIPQNGFSYSINNGATYSMEKLSNSIYAEFGIYIKF